MKESPQHFWHHFALSQENVTYISSNQGIIEDAPRIADQYNEFFNSLFDPSMPLPAAIKDKMDSAYSDMQGITLSEGILSLC